MRTMFLVLLLGIAGTTMGQAGQGLRAGKPGTPNLSESLKKELAKEPRILKKMLTGNIGYLRIPGLVIDPAEKDAALYDAVTRRVTDSLYALAREGARKYIIDLRVDREGIFSPVIAGL